MAFSPPTRPWQGVEAALAGGGRFEHFTPALAALFDLPTEAARELLETVDDASTWSEGPTPGVWLRGVTAGARREGFVTALLRLEPGAQLAFHAHEAEEQVFVLEGGYRDDQSGLEFWRGALDVRAAGTAHSFTALPDLGCLCASISKFASH